MTELDTAKTILGARLNLRSSGTRAGVRARDIMTSGEREAQTISDDLRAHAGRASAAGPSSPSDVNHGEFK